MFYIFYNVSGNGSAARSAHMHVNMRVCERSVLERGGKGAAAFRELQRGLGRGEGTWPHQKVVAKKQNITKCMYIYIYIYIYMNIYIHISVCSY